MAQIDYDSHMDEEDSQCAQAENLATADVSARIFQDEPLERDLDAHVVDADISGGSEDGFMAEEVEYQDDHSLEMGAAVLVRPSVGRNEESDEDMTLDE